MDLKRKFTLVFYCMQLVVSSWQPGYDERCTHSNLDLNLFKEFMSHDISPFLAIIQSMFVVTNFKQA